MTMPRAKTPLRALQITVCNFPPEIRVLKAAKSLRDAGHASAVLCPPMKNRPAREEWNGITIFRPESLAASNGAADKLLFQSAFRSPAWTRAIREVIGEFKPDVLHVHDIWLASSVFAARGGERVVMDLHENMPAAVVEYLKGFRGAKKLFNWMFKRRSRVLRHERDALAKSDLTLVVVDEAGTRVRAEHPRLAADRVIVVENLESKDFLEVTPSGTAPPVGNDTRPSVLYVGGFGPHRGIDTVAESMKHLKEWGIEVRLDLVGAKPGQYVDMLRELITRHDVWSHVNMLEWVPSEAVLPMIRAATIGTVPHHSNPHTDNTIPHKLFQYMIAGTPVLVSTSAPLARTVGAAKSGGIFKAGDALDCAKTIRAMLADRAALAQMGANGRDYTLAKGHNWEDESAPRLIAAYDSLAELRRATPGQR